MYHALSKATARVNSCCRTSSSFSTEAPQRESPKEASASPDSASPALAFAFAVPFVFSLSSRSFSSLAFFAFSHLKYIEISESGSTRVPGVRDKTY